MPVKQNTESREKILVITMSGGGGHIQAAKAKYKQIKAKAPHTRFIFCDILNDSFGPKIGNFLLKTTWNFAQENGHVNFQEWLQLFGVPISEKFFWIPYFMRILYILVRNKIDRIIDTQILGTSAIIKAIRLCKLLTGRKVIYEKIITELPSEYITHYTNSIKHLSEKERKILQIHCSFLELLDKKKKDEFWPKLCNVQSCDVIEDIPPLREHFLKLMGKPKSLDPMDIAIYTHSKKEVDLIQSATSQGYIDLQEDSPYLKMPILPSDRVSIIMLGSRPHQNATLNYVSNFIEMARAYPHPKYRDLLFVFCRNFDERPNSLLKRVAERVAFEPNFPKHLTVIPMPFQDDDVIAPLFLRSDMTLTRAGGITAMELLSVCQGKIWIHTEKNELLPHSNRIGMPCWEEGNAQFLIQQKNANYITPDSFFSLCKDFFIDNNSQFANESLGQIKADILHQT